MLTQNVKESNFVPAVQSLQTFERRGEENGQENSI